MKICLSWVAVWILGSALSFAAEKPNIIVIYTDDHGWPDIGAAGIYDDLKTPHIDALASSGVRATSGYSTAPQCVPSRAGLLAGRAQNRFGVESNAETLEGFDAQITIAERLKKAGYATGQIGKWHLGPAKQITDHGFDDVYNKNANRPCFANFNLQGETIDMQLVDDDLYHLDACSEAALAFLDRHADQPFFLYLAYRAPHVPLDAPQKYLDRFPGKMPQRRRQALAMISAMDDGVGRIVADLKERNLEKDTLIFYIGDNGAPLKIHKHDAPGGGPGWDGSLNEPMNGEKGMLAEGGIRVPFVVSWPGTIPDGQVYEHPITTLDVAATSVGIAGLETDAALDGVNLIPFLSGETQGAPHQELTWRWIAQSAIREGDWKLLQGGPREYLFNLKDDPGEKEDLLSKQPELADRLRKKLTAWAGELQPPGLNTQPMSTTWENYFDFYLEGKAAPPLNAQSDEERAEKTGGWIARNATASIKNGTLRVVPSAAAKKQAPFLAASKLSISGPFTLTAHVKAVAGGRFGISWRTKKEKDFVQGNSVFTEVKGSPEWQIVALEVPEQKETIHLRLLLPAGGAQLQKIDVEGENSGRTWDFGK